MNGKGSKQRSGLTQESRSKYDEIDFLSEGEEEFLKVRSLAIMKYANSGDDLWRGVKIINQKDGIKTEELCWGFSQRQCFDKLKKYML